MTIYGFNNSSSIRISRRWLRYLPKARFSNGYNSKRNAIKSEQVAAKSMLRQKFAVSILMPIRLFSWNPSSAPCLYQCSRNVKGNPCPTIRNSGQSLDSTSREREFSTNMGAKVVTNTSIEDTENFKYLRLRARRRINSSFAMFEPLSDQKSQFVSTRSNRSSHCEFFVQRR